MKPIVLYEENENTFTSNGLGTLSEAISAEITEELNGTYEMTFTYPVTGLKFSEIKHSRIVKAVASPGGDYQLFRIYNISKPINGIITVNAEHISYQLSYIVVNPFTATSAVDAMAKLSANATSDCPFEFWTDKQTVANYKQETPDNIRARLAGVSGSILDVYGGEYEFDNYTVKLHNHRGQNRNVTLRYGKNITDIEQEENIASTYTSIVGFWKGEDEVVKTAVIDSQYASAYPFKRVKVVDFSQEYETAPTVVQLTARATSYMNSNNFGIPNVSIKVSFVALWQTEEYKDIAVLERVYLGDTVSVYYEKLGITASAKVVRTRYNVLLDRYDSIELGKLRSNLSNKLAKQDIEIKEQIVDTRSALERAVEHATELIRGGLGGHVVLNTDADGKPQEILVMDTDDIHTATKVWRWNLGGLGYSKTGYDGNYGTAITMDGAIVADFITAGTMQANRVRAGVLEDETHTNYWNLNTGELRISSNTKIGSGNDTFQSVIDGIQDQIDGNITSWFYNYQPTLSNAPASTWTTVNDRIAHIGDLFYNSDTGYCYRWQVKSNATDPAHPTLNDFEWVRISDEDISEAMRMASDAQDTADGKRRVFVSTPVPPYDVGDLWSQGATGDLLRCATPRTSAESYHVSDWVKASKYTDDTEANNVRDDLNLRIDGVVGEFDLKISGIFANYTGSDVPTTSNYPASSWADADKPLHVGEVYYKTPQTEQDTGVYYRYTEASGVYSWKVVDTTDGNYAVVTSEFKQTKNLISTEVASSATTINNSINENFANYVKTTTPTTSNSPANSWTTDELKLQHNGDICYNKNNGRYYKWTVTFNADGSINTASWVQQTVSHKYDLVISTSKSRMEQTENSFSIAVGAERTAREQADLAATYNYTGTTAPTNPWTDADRNHVGEIYYRSDTQQYYVFERTGTNTYAWVQTTISRAFDLTTTSNLARFNMAEDEILLEVSKSEKRLFANYTGEVTPTNNNYPASSWTTDALKKAHENEVYYDTVVGKYYKYGLRKPDQIQIQLRYATESPNDYLNIIVPNTANNTASVYKITGGDTSSQSSYSIRTIYFDIPDDNIYFKWHTDSSNSYYGYHFNTIRKVYRGGASTDDPDEIVTNPTYPSSPSSFQSDSAHPYANNQDIDFIAITSELPVYNVGYGWTEIATDDMPFSAVTSQIRQTAEEISLKVDKGGVISEINLSSDAIELNTAGRLIITAGNFKVDAQGNITAANATLTSADIEGSLTTGDPDAGLIIIDGGSISGYYGGSPLFTIDPIYDSDWGEAILDITSDAIGVVASGRLGLSGSCVEISSTDQYDPIIIPSNGDIQIYTHNSINLLGLETHIETTDCYLSPTTLYIQAGTINVAGNIAYDGTVFIGSNRLTFVNGILVDWQ